MGIEGLLRYRHNNPTAIGEQRWGFFCPTSHRVWISSCPEKIVNIKGTLYGHEMRHNLFEAELWRRVWVLVPVVEVDEDLIWE